MGLQFGDIGYRPYQTTQAGGGSTTCSGIEVQFVNKECQVQTRYVRDNEELTLGQFAQILGSTPEEAQSLYEQFDGAGNVFQGRDLKLFFLAMDPGGLDAVEGVWTHEEREQYNRQETRALGGFHVPMPEELDDTKCPPPPFIA